MRISAARRFKTLVLIGQTRAATFNGLAAQEKEFEYAERAYERAAREGKPLDMTLYFEERSRQ